MICSAAILLLFLAPIILSIVVSLPMVQNKIIDRATTYASQHLGTEVRIGEIAVSMSGGVIIYDFLTRDLQQDTLIFASRLESQINPLTLMNRRVTLGKTTLKGGVVNLIARINEEGESEMNIRQVTKLLMAKDRSKPQVVVDVESVELDDVTLRIKQLTPKNPEYGVDMRDMELNNISAKVSNLMIDGPSLHGDINDLSFEERSGFVINSLSGELYLTEGALAISNMTMQSLWSSLNFEYLHLANGTWRDYRHFNTTTMIDAVVRGGNISSDDLAYFAPDMRNWGVEFYDIAFAAHGEVADLDLNISNIRYGEQTSLNSTISIKGLPDVNSMLFDCTIGEAVTTSLDLDQLKWALTKSGFDESTHSILESLGTIELFGSAKGGVSKFKAAGSILTESGEVTTDMSVAHGGDIRGVKLQGVVDVVGAQMGKILPASEMGEVTMSVDVDGVVDGRESHIAVESDIKRVVWRNHTLQQVAISGEMANGGLSDVEITSRDPELNFNLRGDALRLFRREAIPRYDMELDLHNADLKVLGINRHDSLSCIRGAVRLTGEGRDKEACWGDLQLSRVEYLYNRDTLSIGNVEIVARSAEGDREATIKSDFLTANCTSHSPVKDITSFLRGAVARYLPALYRDPEGVIAELSLVENLHQSRVVDSDFNSRINIELLDATPLAKLFVEDLTIGAGSTFNMQFDPHIDNFEATLASPYFEHGTTLATNITGWVDGVRDSMTIRSNIEELLVGTSFINKSSFNASLREDKVDMRLRFVNPADSSKVDIGARVAVDRDKRGDHEFDMSLLPSSIVRRGVAWRVRANGIKVNKQGFDIDRFSVASRNQELTINGRASNLISDTMRISMRNFDLSILSTFIAKLGYNIEGSTNGEAYISSALKSRRIEAAMELDSVSVNTLAAPPMMLRAKWDTQRNRASLLLENRRSQDTLMRGYYVPSEVRYYALLEVDSLNMGILDPPLKGVITDTEGTAKLSLTLRGMRREAHLNGTITTHNLSTTVGYTKARYSMPNAVIDVNDNLLQINSATVTDQMEGRGTLTMQVDLQHLSNIEYNLRVALNKMLVLDTKEVDNSTFYGRVFASGVAEIGGGRSGVKMNIVAQTDAASQFFMPLANKSNISEVDFITFVQPQLVDTTNMMQMRRLQLEQRKRQSVTGDMEINMSLNVTPDTEVQLVIDPTVGDIIKARGTGQMNLRIEPKSGIFDMYGDYSIEEGNYLFTLRNIINKRFVIDPGSSIQWTGSPMDPLLDINAIYQLKTSLQPLISDESSRAIPVNCVVNLSDRLSQPNVSFSIELPSADPEQQAVVSSLLNDQETISRQFFYLMLANAFISESSATGASDIGVSTTAATGFELLTNQLSNWLSSSNYNIVIRYRPESELSGDEVDFGFSHGLINNRLLVELEGNYIIDNKQAVSEDASNFMGDAYITWLIDRTGSLRLRGFTQTIDRYDENQGLQETGIGIYYRDDFNNFRDLQQRVKARFKPSDERLEHRAERRATRLARKEEEENEEGQQNENNE